MKSALCLATLMGLVVGCASKPLQYYQPRVVVDQVESTSRHRTDAVLSVETFVADVAYDDQRIVYRTSAYRFDYYHFHRWSASPAVLVSRTLREVYRQTGRFRAVVGGLDPRARLLLGGRVVAMEEVDVSEDEWVARVVVELTLRDNVTGEVLWNDLVDERAPIQERSPEGVTRAMSVVLTRIGTKTAPVISDAARAAAPPRGAPLQNVEAGR